MPTSATDGSRNIILRIKGRFQKELGNPKGARERKMTAKKPSEMLQRKRRYEGDLKGCARCGVLKPFDEFHKFKKYERPGSPVYLSSECKSCRSEDARRKRYGVSLAELISREGSALCPLCEKRIATCIDHDHETGVTRAALCQTCNKAMHYVDNREWLERAEAYRSRFKQPKLEIVA